MYSPLQREEKSGEERGSAERRGEARETSIGYTLRGFARGGDIGEEFEVQGRV